MSGSCNHLRQTINTHIQPKNKCSKILQPFPLCEDTEVAGCVFNGEVSGGAISHKYEGLHYSKVSC